MSSFNELKSKVEALHSYGESIIHLADELSKTILSLMPEQFQKVTPKGSQPKVKTSISKPLTLNDVRHRLSMLAQAGFAAEATSLITRYGVKKISDLDPAIYNELLVEVDTILNNQSPTQPLL